MSDRKHLTPDEAIGLLAVVEHQCEGCQEELDANGFVTGHEAHGPRRRTVHSMSVGSGFALGADWDESGVHDWLRRADEIVDTNGWMGHGVAAHAIATAPPGVHNPRDYERPRWYAFETREVAS